MSHDAVQLIAGTPDHCQREMS